MPGKPVAGRHHLTVFFSVVWSIVGSVFSGSVLGGEALPSQPAVQLGMPYVVQAGQEDLLSPHLFLTDGRELDLRSGALFPIGQGTLERRVRAAWQFEASLIQPYRIHSGGWECFWEIGIGYSQWEGDRGRLTTSGIFQSSVLSDPQFFDRFQETRLKRLIHRYGFVGIGASWPVPAPHGSWRLTARLGSRLGSIRAKFDNRPTAELQNAVNAAIAGGADPSQFVFNSDVNSSDISVGLFANIGINGWIPDVWLGAWHLGDLAIGAEVGFGHDWMDFGDFNRSDSGIGSFATLLTIGLYH